MCTIFTAGRGKVIFSQACVIHSIHRLCVCVCVSACNGQEGVSASRSERGVYTPLGRHTTLLGRHPPGQTLPLGRHSPMGRQPYPPPPRRPLKRVVHILLECTLSYLRINFRYDDGVPCFLASWRRRFLPRTAAPGETGTSAPRQQYHCHRGLTEAHNRALITA